VTVTISSTYSFIISKVLSPGVLTDIPSANDFEPSTVTTSPFSRDALLEAIISA